MTPVVDSTVPVALDHGAFEVHESFPSLHLQNERKIAVWTPPGYSADLDRRYPVFYMHDGQNLFDPEEAFVPGQIWAADRAAYSLIADGRIPPIIIVGVYNTGIHRMAEYTPSVDPRLGQGGKADLYGRFLVEELKPFVDESYRTIPFREATGLGGSSLGGLATLHLGLRYPEIFSRLAVMSPAVWWHSMEIVGTVCSIEERPETSIWLDMGTREGQGHVGRLRVLREALVQKGWTLGEDLGYFEARNARHTERAWSRRIGMALEFLFRE
jgi:predicted alpha/beta superfamily hydrolase